VEGLFLSQFFFFYQTRVYIYPGIAKPLQFALIALIFIFHESKLFYLAEDYPGICLKQNIKYLDLFLYNYYFV
jgi:hypothetical protein